MRKASVVLQNRVLLRNFAFASGIAFRRLNSAVKQCLKTKKIITQKEKRRNEAINKQGNKIVYFFTKQKQGNVH